MDHKDEHRKLIISFLLGLIVGIGATWLWYVVKEPRTNIEGPTTEDVAINKESQSAATADSFDGFSANQIQEANTLNAPVNATTAAGNSISVPDQEAGRVVTVDRIELRQPAWVVVHELNIDGTAANALGAGWFAAGESSGALELLRETEPGYSYLAVLYNDDGDRVFEYRGADTLRLTSDGKPISVTFTTK